MTDEDSEKFVGDASAAFIAKVNDTIIPSTLSSHPGRVIRRLKRLGITSAEIWKCSLRKKRKADGFTLP